MKDWQNIAYRYTATCDQIHGRINNCASECNLGFILSVWCFFYEISTNHTAQYTAGIVNIDRRSIWVFSPTILCEHVFFLIVCHCMDLRFFTLYVCIFFPPQRNQHINGNTRVQSSIIQTGETMIKAFNIFSSLSFLWSPQQFHDSMSEPRFRFPLRFSTSKQSF